MVNVCKVPNPAPEPHPEEAYKLNEERFWPICTQLSVGTSVVQVTIMEVSEAVAIIDETIAARATLKPQRSTPEIRRSMSTA